MTRRAVLRSVFKRAILCINYDYLTGHSRIKYIILMLLLLYLESRQGIYVARYDRLEAPYLPYSYSCWPNTLYTIHTERNSQSIRANPPRETPCVDVHVDVVPGICETREAGRQDEMWDMDMHTCIRYRGKRGDGDGSSCEEETEKLLDGERGRTFGVGQGV